MNAAYADLQHQLQGWWARLPAPVRSRAWPALFGWLTIVALLLAFHQVVRGAVQQGEVLRMAAATHADAVWRCNALRGNRMRETCLAQLNAPPRDPPMASTHDIATVATVSHVATR